ncbi:MAG TPA: hypothetical protein VJG32_06520 [Anaerolineae bacterium]|nr:hypothetical protein [Anaerolineae bacterium]
MESMQGPALAAARTLKRQVEASLMQKANVVATGVGFKIAGDTPTNEPAVIVSVVQKLPLAQLAPEDVVPKTVDGVPTDVVETGEIVAFQDPKQKMRPARPGVSIGHYQITAGTLGCLVRKGSEILILSNNHVLANSNTAQIGDAILQPGPYDGGAAADQIGTLAEFIPIAFDGATPAPPGCLAQLLALLGLKPRSPAQQEPGNNKIDAALARPTTPNLVNPDILNIGVPAGVGTATLGTAVQKSGRTTGYTTSTILQIDVTVTVNYGGPLATFTSQLMAGAMSQGGDSGSAVLDMSKRVVGLLYAGSNTTTILNPIQFVLDMLNVTIVT